MRKILNLFFQIFILLGSFNYLSPMDFDEEDCGIGSPYLKSPEIQTLSSSFEALSSSLKKQETDSPRLSALNKELAKAIRSGKVGKVKKLLKRGAQMDMVNTPKTGNSSLHLAVLASKKVFETIELALKSGAEKNARGKDGRTFLFTFISQYTEKAFTDFAACVWLYNINLAVVDNEGNTLLHAAAEAGRLDWIVFLLSLFECKFEAEDKLLDFLLLLQSKNGIEGITPEEERETAAQLAERLGIYFQKASDFNKSIKCAKIAEVLEKEIKLLTQKWETSKQSLTTSFDKKKVRRKLKRLSVGEYY